MREREGAEEFRRRRVRWTVRGERDMRVDESMRERFSFSGMRRAGLLCVDRKFGREEGLVTLQEVVRRWGGW